MTFAPPSKVKFGQDVEDSPKSEKKAVVETKPVAPSNSFGFGQP